MFFNSLDRKLKKAYKVINPEIAKKVFPIGEKEFLYVGIMLDVLCKKQNVLELLKLYVSAYEYYQITMGNTFKTYNYIRSKSSSILTENETKNLLALAIFNQNYSKLNISDPAVGVRQFRGYIDSYIGTVEGIRKNKPHFQPESLSAGTVNSPLLVDGVYGVKQYINALKIPGVEEITYERKSTLHLTHDILKVNYAIDEYILYNAENSEKIATLWFNIYGTENTDVLPACFSDKIPFSAEMVCTELVDAIIQEWMFIEKLAQERQIPYSRINLLTAMFAYVYVIWIFTFSIRGCQCDEIEERYLNAYTSYLKKLLEDEPQEAVVEGEVLLKDMRKRVERRVRDSYHKNNRTLVDDGLSSEFIQEFVLKGSAGEKIKTAVSKRIFENWVAFGTDADQRYLT